MDNLDSDLEKAETQASSQFRDFSPERTHSYSNASRGGILSSFTNTTHHETQELHHQHTVGASAASRLASRKSLPDFGAGKPYPPPLPAERTAYVVDFTGPDDPLHPFNWPLRQKLPTAAIAALACLSSTFASAVFSAATSRVAEYFHVSVEVSALSSSLYLFGYGVGPGIFAPMSELRGRKLPLIIAMFGFTVFSAGSATAKDLQTLLLCRFFMGVFGGGPLAVVAALYADMFAAPWRGTGLTVFASSIFMGPMIAPFIGGFTVSSYLGWRWDAYWSLIMGAGILISMVLFLKETYPPTILVNKASELRRRTQNWAIHAKQEEIEIDIKELLEKNLTRPFRMLVTEPILLLITIYLSFVYGILYIFLTAYPLVFQGVHHMNRGVGGLPLLGMATGMLLAGFTAVCIQPAWRRKYAANNQVVVPEWRLPLSIVGAVSFTIGLFWFAWTGNYESVHWIVPTLSGLMTGFGLLAIFMMLFMYLVDAYLMFAASAIAANTIVRSCFAASVPLFARQMFGSMTIKWAGSLLAFVSLALMPVPILFAIYGERLRQKSHFAPTSPPVQKEVIEDQVK